MVLTDLHSTGSRPFECRGHVRRHEEWQQQHAAIQERASVMAFRSLPTAQLRAVNWYRAHRIFWEAQSNSTEKQIVPCSSYTLKTEMICGII